MISGVGGSAGSGSMRILILGGTSEAREMAVPAALNDSFGFGGHNTALLFRAV